MSSNSSSDEVDAYSNKINQRLGKAIDHLKQLKDVQRFYSDRSDKSYRALTFIGNSLDKFDIDIYENDIDIRLFDAEFVQVLSKLLLYLYEIRHDLDFDVVIDLDLSDRPRDLNEKRIFTLNYVILISHELECNSLELYTQFVLKQGLKALLSFLDDDTFLKQNQCFLGDGDFSEFVDSAAINLFNMRFTCDELRHVWVDLNAVNVLAKIGRIKDSSKFISYATLLYVADDLQIETLKDIFLLAELLLAHLLKAKHRFEKNNVKRAWKKINFKGKLVAYQTLHINVGNSFKLSVVYILDCLYKLACNPKVKSKMYFMNEMKSCLRTIFYEGK